MVDVIDLCDSDDNARPQITRVKPLGVRVRTSAAKAVKPRSRLSEGRSMRKRARRSVEAEGHACTPRGPMRARRRVLLGDEDEDEDEEQQKEESSDSEEDNAVVIVESAAAVGSAAAPGATSAPDLDSDEELAIVGGDIGLVRAAHAAHACASM